ncbi:bacteriophage Mu tail sheath family protein [Pandoraea anapnoica]|uniref:Bacteriophage Mu tail sheath family protein n=1 Tax=Pandoraea anapnoica TaxID=2508301 RepID=A0A5E5AJS2_9BURK|nr:MULTISPECIES: phage tail sheath subtilisin-like domain-containing protein [Pandoraea]VVE14733.1 bacteriophage Mu tail sheath family protein [Pandoraea iniqua]VVE73326.1 bacteriophage Mu tail sheath family protein [Pandoraea anapnoica]
MSSPNVTIYQIPPGRKPGHYFEFNTKAALNTLPANDQSMIIVGQRTTEGQLDALVPLDIYSEDQAADAFGNGSLAHIAVTAALTANRYLALTVIAVDDAAAGQPAHGTVTFDGTATADGAFALFIGNARVDVKVSSGDDADTVAASLVDAITQAVKLPVTATATAGAVTITAKNKGEFGNGIVTSQLNQALGITATLTPFAGGLNDPDIAPALAKVFGAAYTIYAICWATETALTKLRDHVNAVSHPLEQRRTMGFAGTSTTLASATTLAGDLNGERVTIAWHPQSLCLPAQIGPAYAATVATESDPARPFDNLAIPGLDVTPVAAWPGRTEQEKALHNGVTPLQMGPGNAVQIVRAITTYTETPEGTEDPSLLDITTVRSLDYTAKSCKTRIDLRYPRSKIAAKTPANVRSDLLDVLYTLEQMEILRFIDKYKDGLIVEEDLQEVGQLCAAIPAPVVPGFHVLAARIDLYL